MKNDADMNAPGSILCELNSLRKIVAGTVGRLRAAEGPHADVLMAACDRHHAGDYDGALPTIMAPIEPPAPPDAAALVTEAELAEVEGRTSGPGPLAGDGPVLRRLAAEVRRLTVAAKEHVCASTIDRDLHREYGETAARLISTEQERDAARAEVAERDAQIARLAVDSDATEAALRAQVEAAEQRVQDFRDAAHDLLLDAEGSAVEGHSEVQTRLLDVLQGLADS